MDQKQNMEWFRKNLPQKTPDQFKVLILPGVLDQSLTNCGTIRFKTGERVWKPLIC